MVSLQWMGCLRTRPLALFILLHTGPVSKEIGQIGKTGSFQLIECDLPPNARVRNPSVKACDVRRYDLCSEYLSQDCRLVGDTGRRELRSSHNYTSRALPQAHGLAIVRSLPPDHDSGTVCQQMSVGPTSQPKLSAEVEDVFVWSRCQHLVTVVFRRCV